MNTFKIFIVLAYIGQILSSEIEISHSKQFEKCKMAYYQRKFGILPGRGWDNLKNEEMGQILYLNFSKCQFSQDNEFLIPDSVSLTPTRMSVVKLSAESFSHFANYTSVTSESMNLGWDVSYLWFSPSGSFSKEKENVKIDQIKTRSSINRVQLRYNVFKSYAEPDAELHPTFRNRIMDIAGLVIENKDSLYPAYLADMIVRDYGTHIIRSIDAGAVLNKIDYLRSQYASSHQHNTDQISIVAAASFVKIFNISGQYSKRVSLDEVNEYDTNCVKSRIETHGGTLLGSNFSIEKWEHSVLDHMVPIDRRGDPIYYVITPRSLNELDDGTVHKVYTLLKQAVKRYFEANTRSGCLDINATNFNPDANIDGKNCESPKIKFNFGGVFQNCSGPNDQCQLINEVNPLSGGYSCPEKYEEVLLMSGLFMCREYCQSSWYISRKCQTLCSRYYSYWCYPINVNETISGFQFGGVISRQMPRCPDKYISLKFGLTAQICVSINNDPANVHAIKFGGFYSCSAGNPLALYSIHDTNNLQNSKMWPLEHWPKMCASGYIAHLAAMDQGCQLAYCAETNKVSLGQLPLVNRPPFISLNYNPNSTKVVVFSTSQGQVMIKSELGEWEISQIKIKEKNLILSCVLGTFFGMCFLAIVALWIQRRNYKKKLFQIQRNEMLMDPTVGDYGSINESNNFA